MMGSGKSTVGRALATALGWPLLDNDALVREATGRDGPTIFRDEGEAALHRAESDALTAALRRAGPAVVTAAASVVDDPRSRVELAEAGHVVWLRARSETLGRRIAAGTGRRSDAADGEWLARLNIARAAGYEAVADQVVDVDARDVEDIAREIRDAAHPADDEASAD